jgi:hypothetical protein
MSAPDLLLSVDSSNQRRDRLFVLWIESQFLWVAIINLRVPTELVIRSICRGRFMLEIVATTNDFQTNLPNPTSNWEIGGSIGQKLRYRQRDRIHKSYDLKVTGG